MGSDQVSDATVFAAALILLLSIVAKVVSANMIAKIRKDYNLLDQERRGFLAKLKQAQLAGASARGTYEFWQRRLTETAQKVQDATRDLEAYQGQFRVLDSETERDPDDDEGDFGEEFEIAAAVSEMAESFAASERHGKPESEDSGDTDDETSESTEDSGPEHAGEPVEPDDAADSTVPES